MKQSTAIVLFTALALAGCGLSTYKHDRAELKAQHTPRVFSCPAPDIRQVRKDRERRPSRFSARCGRISQIFICPRGTVADAVPEKPTASEYRLTCAGQCIGVVRLTE
jgi:hypothetical protein